MKKFLLLFMIILLAVSVYAECPPDCGSDDINYGDPETITVDNIGDADLSQLNAQSLESAGVSAEQIKEKVTPQQAMDYKSANQPITNPTDKELALLSKIQGFENVNTDSLKGGDVTVDGNKLTSGDATVHIKPGSNPTITRNSDGSLNVGDDLVVSKGDVTDHGDGHITIGDNSLFRLKGDFMLNGDLITSDKPLDLYDVSKTQPPPAQPNSIVYDDNTLSLHVANNNVKIVKSPDSIMNNLFVGPITDGSQVTLVDTPASEGDGIPVARFSSEGTTYQNRDSLSVNIANELPYGDHNQYNLGDSQYMCSECKQCGTEIMADQVTITASDGTELDATKYGTDHYAGQYAITTYIGPEGNLYYVVQTFYDQEYAVVNNVDTGLFEEYQAAVDAGDTAGAQLAKQQIDNHYNSLKQQELTAPAPESEYTRAVAETTTTEDNEYDAEEAVLTYEDEEPELSGPEPVDPDDITSGWRPGAQEGFIKDHASKPANYDGIVRKHPNGNWYYDEDYDKVQG